MMYKYVCSFCHKEFYSEVEILDRKTRCPICEERVRKANEKRVQTCLAKYGTTNVAKVDKIKESFIKTNLERNGGMGFALCKDQTEIQKKAHNELAYKRKKKTNNERLGVDWPAQSKAVRDKMEKTYLDKTGYRNSMQNPEDRYKCISKGYFYENTHFDSSWELAFYIWLKDNHREFLYHPKLTMDYIDDYGINRVYYPDFLVEGKFYEVKGDQFFDEKGEPFNQYTGEYWRNKYNLLIQNNVIILKMDDIKFYLKYIKDKYGKNYLKSFKDPNKKGSEAIENSELLEEVE